MDQLSLFQSPEPQKKAEPEKQPEKFYTLHQVVGDFLKTRQKKNPTPECRNCHCTEARPCKLWDGDTCILDYSTGYCSAPRCAGFGVARAS